MAELQNHHVSCREAITAVVLQKVVFCQRKLIAWENQILAPNVSAVHVGRSHLSSSRKHPSRSLVPWAVGAICCSLLVFVLLVSTAFAEQPQQLALKVAGAAVSHSIDEKTALVTVTLAPASQIAFSSFTAQHLGQRMEVRFLGQPLMKARLMEQITGGRLQISPGANGNDAGELARKLSAPSTEIEVAAPVE